jgi:hypothetical protein
MLHFFKKGIRGGVSTCVKRWCHANNKFLPEYNLLEPSSFILYLDATNLYGYAMKQYLPTGSFEWLTRNEIGNFNLNELSDTSDFGYILEVDLIYPETLLYTHCIMICHFAQKKIFYKILLKDTIIQKTSYYPI